MHIIVTGAAGYIGAHVAHELLKQGCEVIGLDNLSSGKIEFVDPRVNFLNVDLSDANQVNHAINGLGQIKPLAVIHIAGIKYAGESTLKPWIFYKNNLAATLNLLDLVKNLEIKNFVFSSSCSVYGNSKNSIPVTEDFILNPVSPYGRSKMFAEKAILDFAHSINLNTLSLRYFNVAGNDLINAYDTSNFNLFPNLYKSVFNNSTFQIFGNDYATKDGTGIRDYVDVRILAQAHVQAVTMMLNGKKFNRAINLGSGMGYSVLEIISGAKEIFANQINFEFAPRRYGDPDSILADVREAKKILGWSHETTVKELITTGWEAWNRNSARSM